MTPPVPSNPMTREELLELAALDALGMLDAYESALFTRSFHLAPPAFQAELIDLQAAVSADESMLPGVTPPEDLRRRVLDAVARAAEIEAAELAPIAAIGVPISRRRSGGGRTNAVTGSTPVWRAAAFLLAAALVVAFYFGLQLLDTNRSMARTMAGVVDEGQIDKLLGPSFRAFAEDPTARRIALAPARGLGDEPIPARSAIVYINEETGEAYLFAVGLAEGEGFTLTARGSEGTVLERHFDVRNAVAGVRIGELAANALTAVSWSIVDATGAVVLRSA